MAWTAPRTWTDGELVTAAIMNPHIRDNQLAMGPHLIARKTADETTTSTSLQNDDVLFTPSIGANAVWRLDFHLITLTTTTDINFAVSFPSGTFAGLLTGVQNNYMLSGTGTVTNTQNADSNNSASGYPHVLTGVFYNGATPGAVTLQWSSVNGTSVMVRIGSSLWGIQYA